MSRIAASCCGALTDTRKRMNDAGIQVEHACNTLVDSNTVTGNGGFGINVQNSSHNTISNNVVSVPKSSNDGGIRRDECALPMRMTGFVCELPALRDGYRCCSSC